MMPGSQDSQWYVSIDGQVLGPYAATALVDWIASGHIKEGSLVSDGTQWIATQQFLAQQARIATVPPDLPADLPYASRAGDLPLAPQPQPSHSNHTQSTHQPDQTHAASPAQAENEPLERDRILVIGRRQSGKTVYLSTLYAMLWKSIGGISAKAISGDVHRALMSTYQSLLKGQWPSATVHEVLQVDLEIEYEGVKRLMVTADYSGELFRKAFVEEDSTFAGVKELTNNVDRALAVILLIDPSIVAGDDYDAAIDDDFGLVQAVNRIRNWPGGEDVPVVVALSKMDRHQHLIDAAGGSRAFVRKYFPAMVRTLRQVPIFQISAVQSIKGTDGKQRPNPDSHPINVDNPLKYCLQQLNTMQQAHQQQFVEQQQRVHQQTAIANERAREKRQNAILIFSLGTILVLGLLIALWIIIK